MERPRVVVFTPVFPPRKGGSATYFSTLVKLLSDRVDFTVVTLETEGAPGEETVDGVRIIRSLPERFDDPPVRRYRDVLPASFSTLNRLRKEGDYLLHIHSNGIYGYSASLFSSLHSIPLIKEVQDTSDKGFVLKAGNVKRWIAVGEFVSNRLESFGIQKERIIMFPTMNPPALEGLINKARVKKREDKEKFRVLFIGWLVNRIKGVDVLIKGFEKAIGKKENMELVIIGEGSDRKGLESICTHLPVKFVGETPYQNILEWMAVSDVLVLTSHEEANPRVILEAYAMGLPVIATDVGGVKEEVMDGQTGILVSDGSSEEVAAAILKLADDPELRRNMGKAGKKFLGELPTWEELSDTIYHLYLEYMNEGK